MEVTGIVARRSEQQVTLAVTNEKLLEQFSLQSVSSLITSSAVSASLIIPWWVRSCLVNWVKHS